MGGKSTEGINFSAGADAANIKLKDESYLKGTMSGDLSGFNEEESEEESDEVGGLRDRAQGKG